MRSPRRKSSGSVAAVEPSLSPVRLPLDGSIRRPNGRKSNVERWAPNQELSCALPHEFSTLSGLVAMLAPAQPCRARPMPAPGSPTPCWRPAAPWRPGASFARSDSLSLLRHRYDPPVCHPGRNDIGAHPVEYISTSDEVRNILRHAVSKNNNNRTPKLSGAALNLHARKG